MNLSWWPFGKQVEIPEPKPEYYSAQAVFDLVKRLSAKDLRRLEDFSGLKLIERIQSDDARVLTAAENVTFSTQRIEELADDPLKILFLMDCPEWNNPYAAAGDFDSCVGWMIENHLEQQAAFLEWKKQFLT